MSDNSDGTPLHDGVTSVPPYDPATVHNTSKTRRVCKKKKRHTLPDINEHGQSSGSQGQRSSLPGGATGPQASGLPGYSPPENIATSSYASGTGYYEGPRTADPDIMGHGAPISPSVVGQTSGSPQNISCSRFFQANTPSSMYSRDASGVSQDTTFNMTSASGSTPKRPSRNLVNNTFGGMDASPAIDPRMNATDPGIPFQSYGATPNDSLNSTGSTAPPLPRGIVPITGGCFQSNEVSPSDLGNSSAPGGRRQSQTMNQSGLGNPTVPEGRRQSRPGIPAQNYANTPNSSLNSTGLSAPPTRTGNVPITGGCFQTNAANETGLGNSSTNQPQYMNSFNGLDAQPYPNQRLNQTDPGISMPNSDPRANQTVSSDGSSVGTLDRAFNTTEPESSPDRSLSQTNPDICSSNVSQTESKRMSQSEVHSSSWGTLNRGFNGSQSTESSADPSSVGTLDRGFNATGSSGASEDPSSVGTLDRGFNATGSSGASQDPSSVGTLDRGFNATGSTRASNGSSAGGTVGTLDRGFNATGSTRASNGTSAGGTVGTLDRGFNATGSTMEDDRRKSQTMNQPQQSRNSFQGVDAQPYPNQRLNQTDPGIPMSNANPRNSQTLSRRSGSGGIPNMTFNATGSTMPDDRRISQTMNQSQQKANTFNGLDAQPYPDQRLNQTDPGPPMSNFQPNDQGQRQLNNRPISQPVNPNATYDGPTHLNGVPIPAGIRPISVPPQCTYHTPQQYTYGPPKRSSQQSNPNPRIIGNYERDTSTPNRPYHDNYQNFDKDESFMISAQGGVRTEERQAIVYDGSFASPNLAGQTFVQSPEPDYRTMSSGSWSDMDEYMKQNHPEEYSRYEQNRDYMKGQPGMLGGPVSKPNPPPVLNDQTQILSPANSSNGPNAGRRSQGPNATFPLQNPQQGVMSQSMPDPQRQDFDPNASGGAASNISGVSDQEMVTIDVSAEYARLLARYPQSDPRDYIYGSNPNRMLQQNSPNTTSSESPGSLLAQNQTPSPQGYVANSPQANDSTGPRSLNLMTYTPSPNSSNDSGPRSLNLLPYDGSPNSSNSSGNGQVPNSSNLMAFNTASPDGIYQLKVVCMWNKKT